MDRSDWLAARFEENRTRLQAVAYRMLGSMNESDDAVQEAWLRLSRTDAGEIENLNAWLTTVVSRVCLDMLRSRQARREEPLGEHLPEPVAGPAEGTDPEHEALLADAVGPAVLLILETLNPAERLAFVLHDMFGVPFEEIAPIVGRSPAAARQLASRARRRVQGRSEPPEADHARRQEVVTAFLAASRGGDFEALLALLDPEVVLRADATTVQSGAQAEVHGARAVAETFAGRARAARTALIDGEPGLVWAQGGTPRVVFSFTIEGGRVTGIEMIGDPDELETLDLVFLDR